MFYLPAYSKFGPKTERAEEWGIPIVNHLWVEECFKRWAFVHPAAESGRFVSYPPGINYAEILGQRGIGNVKRGALDLETNTTPKRLESGGATDLDGHRAVPASKAASPKEPVASNVSSAAEVENSTPFQRKTRLDSQRRFEFRDGLGLRGRWWRLRNDGCGR